MREIDPKSRATVWWAVFAVSLVAVALLNQPGGIAEHSYRVKQTLNYAIAIIFLIPVYSARESLVSYFNLIEPIDLEINRYLIFYFNTAYLQYKLNQVCARRGKAAQIKPVQSNNTSPTRASPAADDTLHLQLADQRYVIKLGATFTAAQIPGLTSISASGVVAEVKPNPAQPDVLGLNNQSHETWRVTLVGGEVAQIAAGQTIRLSSGAQFWFGQIAGSVV